MSYKRDIRSASVPPAGCGGAAPMVKSMSDAVVDEWMPARTSGVFSPGRISRWADTSDDLFTASLDFLPGCKEAIDEQPEKSDVHANEKHRVHDFVATCPLIGRGCNQDYPSEDSSGLCRCRF